jgi:hypothetical protein
LSDRVQQRDVDGAGRQHGLSQKRWAVENQTCLLGSVMVS